jgi:hypothetical protein
MKVNRSSMIVQAMLQDEAPGGWGKFAMLGRAEGNEKGPIVTLVVGKATPIFVTAKSCGEHRNRSHQIVPARPLGARAENRRILWLVPK